MLYQPDFVVIGGGVNGLTAACYLLREGLSVVVLEKQAEVGGAAITREITLPGFKHDVFATSINIWRASNIQQELQLEKYGYKEVDPEPVASTPFKNEKAITIFHDLQKTLKSFAKVSKNDALSFEKIYRFYQDSKPILLGGLAMPPLPYSELTKTLEESDTGLEFLQFSFMSARDWLEENFEAEESKAFLALWGSNHVPLSPEDAGSALLILIFIGLLQEKGVGVPIGGIKTLVNALTNFILKNGGNVITNTEVTQIIIEQGRAIGVKTEEDKIIYVKKGIIADVEPKSLFLKLVPDSALEQDFRKKVERFRFSKVTQVMIHAALSDWLNYKLNEVKMAGMVQIGESLDNISKAFNSCIVGELPLDPFMTIDNTTCYDSSRAPPGKHILWDFVRAPVFIKGKPWSEEDKEHFADLCIEKLKEYATNINEIILKRIVLSPQDIQTLNPNLVYGDPGGGKATIDQSLSLRPFPRFSDYRTPIRGLYMCGAATHPGGGISGLPGHNAALQAIDDIKKSKF